MAARPNHGAMGRDYWEQSVSFVHSSDHTVAMGVHDCGATGGGTGENSFSVVLSETSPAVMIAVPAMFPSVTLGGIPTTMVLLPPTVIQKIHPH